MNSLPPEYLDKHKVSQSFDRVASTYEKYTSIQKIVGNELLERLQWLKIEPQRILDVGSGSSQLTRNLSSQYKQACVYAVDIAPQMMAESRKQVISANQFFVCADAAQLPFADNSIDLIVSNMMLQWCNDIHSIFAEFKRVLKSDGALFFSTFGPSTLIELRHSWAKVDNGIHVNHFVDMHDVGDALLEVGLANPVMDVDVFQFTYSEIKLLMQELKHIGAHNIMAGRQRGLMGKTKFQAMLMAYEQYRSEEGLLPVTYEVVHGHTLGKVKEQEVSEKAWEKISMPIRKL